MATINLSRKKSRGGLKLVGKTKKRQKKQSSTTKTINLNSKKKKRKKRSSIAKGLDILSSILLEPTTILTKGFSVAGEKVAERREKIRRGDKTEAFKVIGETITATVLVGGAILGATAPSTALKVVSKAVPTSLRGKIALTSLIGASVTSPTVRHATMRVIENPFAGGLIAGEILEKSKRGEKSPIKDALITGGLLAGGTALLGGVFLGAKKIKEKLNDRKDKTAEDTAEATPFNTPQSNALPPSFIPSPAEAFTEKQAPVIAEEEKINQIPTPSAVNVKVTNKPQINVAIANG